MNVYIGADLYENRGYFVREVVQNGVGPLLNRISCKFEYERDMKESQYYFKTQEIINIINTLKPKRVEISKVIPQIERDIITSNIDGWIYGHAPEVIFNSVVLHSEPAKDSFELGGAL